MACRTFVEAMSAIVNSRSIERFWGIPETKQASGRGGVFGGLLQL